MSQVERSRQREEPASLTRGDVRRLAHLLQLPMDEEELDEVTFRLAALQEELQKLNSEDLAGVEPYPVFPREE